MRNLARGLSLLVCAVFTGITVSGCSSTLHTTKIQIGSPGLHDMPSFRLIDARTQASRSYSQDGKVQYLGDSNFQSPPVKVVAARLNEKLGDLVHGKEISLLEFQARISAPEFQTYPGMPSQSEQLGIALGLPQLGNPHYANVSLRGIYRQKEFSGAKSVQFYLGSGESEIFEAFEAAVSEAATSLRLLLVDENLPN